MDTEHTATAAIAIDSSKVDFLDINPHKTKAPDAPPKVAIFLDHVQSGLKAKCTACLGETTPTTGTEITHNTLIVDMLLTLYSCTVFNNVFTLPEELSIVELL